MRWSDYILHAAEKLTDAGIDDAKANAEYIAAHARGIKSRSELRSKISDRIKYKHAVSFSQLIYRRIGREPLQYILDEWEFYGLPMKVRSGVLIPRPETEILVEQAISESVFFEKYLSILDIGTGSGAIALALAKTIPRAKVNGIDSSGKAIAIAKENMKRLNLKNVFFQKRDIFSEKWLSKQTKQFDLIVSNPPYISQADFDALPPEIRLYEPREALTDGSTGLTFYEQIAPVAKKLLNENGVVLLELGFGADKLVEKIMTSAGFEVKRIVPDLAGIPRVLVARLSKS